MTILKERPTRARWKQWNESWDGCRDPAACCLFDLECYIFTNEVMFAVCLMI